MKKVIHHFRFYIIIVSLSYFQNSYAQRTFFKDLNKEVSYECSCNQPKKHRGFEYSFWITEQPISIKGIQAYPFYWGDSANRSDTTGYLYLNENNELYFIEDPNKYITEFADDRILKGICGGSTMIAGSSGTVNQYGNVCTPHLFVSFDSLNYLYNYIYTIGDHILSHFAKRIRSDDLYFHYKFYLSNIVNLKNSTTFSKDCVSYLTYLVFDFDNGIIRFNLKNMEGLEFDCRRKCSK